MRSLGLFCIEHKNESMGSYIVEIKIVPFSLKKKKNPIELGGERLGEGELFLL